MSIRDRVAMVSLGRSPDPLLEEVTLDNLFLMPITYTSNVTKTNAININIFIIL